MDKYFAKPDQTIEEHAEKLIKVLELLKEYGYIKDEKLYCLVEKAALHHDDGKRNHLFQSRVRSTKKVKFEKGKEIPHNILSGFLLNPEEFESDEDYYRVLFAIMYHHDYGNPYEIAIEKKELIVELLEGFTPYQLKRKDLNRIQRMVCDDTAIKIKGYLHKCDYSASGDYIAEYPNDFLENSLENIKKKWQLQNPDSDWNELQSFCMGKRNENIIVVAQTGMGKTEAGLQWIGNHKGYFILPLRTAINAIYDRIRIEMLLDDKVDTRLSILHSESLEYYSKHLPDQEMNLLEYENRGKRFSIPLNISTLDQIFDFVFKYQGYELKLTTLSYSKIVVDEIQMYDPELLAYLILGIKRITELGGKTAIMTATLSPFVKELLIKEIQYQEKNIRIFTDDMVRHNVKVRDCKMESDDILPLYFENKKNGKANKILVVCNSIRKAQQMYRELKDKMEEEELHILHSRFTKEDRSEKEKEILKFGQTYDDNEKLDIQSGIWISTSLVEVSLDIDFDYLFTELQDLNSLLQRLGRCNRKGKKDISRPNCFVYLEIDKGMLSSSRSGFIDDTIFAVSQKAMKTVDGILSEKQKMELLDSHLTMENLKESSYYRRYKKAIEDIKAIKPYEYQRDEKKLRNILSENIIPSPVYKEKKEIIGHMIEIFANEKTGLAERIKAKEEIMKYSVNVPYYQWMKYCGAVKNGKADAYPVIDMGRYGKIPVMECGYDGLGYQEIDYEKRVREVQFL